MRTPAPLRRAEIAVLRASLDVLDEARASFKAGVTLRLGSIVELTRADLALLSAARALEIEAKKAGK